MVEALSYSRGLFQSETGIRAAADGNMDRTSRSKLCQWRQISSRVIVGFSFLIACGCSTRDHVGAVAKNLTVAATDAATHPSTWIPLSAGLVFGATGLDEDLSDWAADHQPLFGNANRAADASDFLRSSLFAGVVASSILAPLPSADDTSHAFTLRLVASGLAYGANRLGTDGLKVAFGRERPDKEDDESLPSGHSSSSFNAATLIDLNLANVDLELNARLVIRLGLYGLAGTTAWARLEAREHFPSDVLIGAALGNFLARFIFGGIVGSSAEPPLAIEVGADKVFFRLNRSF